MKTQPPINLKREEYLKDPDKWFKMSLDRRVNIIVDGEIIMSFGSSTGHHDHRVEHKLADQLDFPEEVAKLREHYSQLKETDSSPHIDTIIELLEEWASHNLWNLDDYE